MELQQRTGFQTLSGRGTEPVEVSLEIDDVIFTDRKGKRFRVAWAERKPSAPMLLLAELTESEIAEAKWLLSQRECENGAKWERPVSPPPYNPENEQ